MKILTITNLFPPEFIGGYELLMLEIVTMLANKGHEIIVATSPLVNHSESGHTNGIQIRRELSYTGLSLDPPQSNEKLKSTYINMGNIAVIRRIIEEFKPDRILLGNIDGLGAIGIISFLHDCGMNTVLYLADNPFSEIEQSKQTWHDFVKLYRADRALKNLQVIVISQGILDEIINALGLSLGFANLIPGTVSSSEAKKERDLISKTGYRFVFCSRVAPHKGIHIVIDAARKLIELGENNFQIDIFGGGNIPDLLQKAHAYGLGNHIRYGGLVGREEMLDRYAEYDALLFPTWMREPLGLVAIEAAAKGCIPILTAQTGAAEWLPSTDCIKIERTAEGLAGGMQRVMYLPPHEKERIRNSLKRNIAEYFGNARWHPRIERVLVELPESKINVNPRTVEDAFFAILCTWRG